MFSAAEQYLERGGRRRRNQLQYAMIWKREREREKKEENSRRK
jgi:hypothetical protein